MTANKSVLALTLLAFFTLPLAANAQAPLMKNGADASHGATMREQWQAMTPEQKQQAIQQRHDQWQSMSKEDRAAARENMKDKWNGMSEEQKAAAKSHAKDKWNNLTPEQQDAAKTKWQQHRQMRKNK